MKKVLVGREVVGDAALTSVLHFGGVTSVRMRASFTVRQFSRCKGSGRAEGVCQGVSRTKICSPMKCIYLARKRVQAGNFWP
jgi:hypothetical protein